MKFQHNVAVRRLFQAGVLTVCAASLVACGGDKGKKNSQALASVNGAEITVLQLNEELQRAGIPAAQQQAASKQMLTALVDRQLLLEEAQRQKTDRDPKVMQQIERARTQIIAQAYLQSKLGAISKPTSAEVEAYYTQNPAQFGRRQQFELRQLMVTRSEMTDGLKQALDSSKSLDEVVQWMTSHKVAFVRNQVMRTTADLPPEMMNKLLAMPAGQLFVVNEADRSLVMTLNDLKPVPVPLEQATPQIEQILFSNKAKELSKQEVERLRATAKITYANPEPAAPAAPAASPASAAAAAASATARGVAGLRE